MQEWGWDGGGVGNVTSRVDEKLMVEDEERAGGLILGGIGKWLEVKKPGWVLYGRYLFLFVFLVLYPLP